MKLVRLQNKKLSTVAKVYFSLAEIICLSKSLNRRLYWDRVQSPGEHSIIRKMMAKPGQFILVR
jgi:hypothetical protein